MSQKGKEIFEIGMKKVIYDDLNSAHEGGYLIPSLRTFSKMV